MKRLNALFACGIAAGLAACTPTPPPPPPVAPPPPPPASQEPAAAQPVVLDYGRLDRDGFNRAAVRANAPLYWVADANKNGKVDPDEIKGLLFYPGGAKWVEGGKFTREFELAYEALVKAGKDPLEGLKLDAPEQQRRKLVIEDLDQGRPTLVYNDLRSASDDEKKFVGHMLATAKLIDELFAKQSGMDVLASKVPADDAASQSMFRRNWGPKCVGPKTEKDPACTAIPGAPKPVCDGYPVALQSDPKFCEALEKRPDAKTLLAPFVVVREKDGKLEPVGYHEAWKPLMQAVAKELRAAADVVRDPKEAPLKAYLQAAADGFSSNDWVGADEAWSKMTAQNSKWYLRVAPDEVYWDPCSQKAGFHMTFARINTDSLEWQRKLTPVQQEMEKSLAAHIGAPYKERKVTFHLPDFIDIVTNSGDDRDPMGATIGQSLPNWGPVVAQGRGRTVAMSNLYTDPDSQKIRRDQAESLLSKESMARYSDAQLPGLLSTILHEATHNLGPAHEYKVKGKVDKELFGGPLSSTLEELKAQSGALWYVNLLLRKNILTAEQAQQTYADSVVWALSHISRGMYSESKQPKPYSQLAAIQIGYLMDAGAIGWDAKAKAANGADEGAFVIHFDKLPAAIDKLMKDVGRIKATGDKKKAQELIAKYVDGAVVPMQVITTRMLRHPKASFVYAIDL